jgi:hypothetical protein
VSLTAGIVKLTVAVLEFRLPSFTRNVKLSDPLKFAAGVYVTVAVQVPAAQLGVPIVPNDPGVGPVTIENVSRSALASVADSVITAAVSSGVVTLWPLATGAVLPTLIVTVPTAVPPFPSLTVYVKLSDPEKFALGVYVTFAPPVPTAAVPFNGAVTAVTVNVLPSTSVSFASTLITLALLFFATVALSATATGGSFTAVTVIDTVAAAEANAPSLTVNVKLSGPL